MNLRLTLTAEEAAALLRCQPGLGDSECWAVVTRRVRRQLAQADEKAAQGQLAARETDLMCADWVRIFGTPYLWAAADGVAFAALRKVATLDEVRARWLAGLRASGWKQVRTVAQLRSKWNDLAEVSVRGEF